MSTSSIGLMSLLPPSGVSARPKAVIWPLPDSPTNVRPSTQLMRDFMCSSPNGMERSLSPRRAALQCGQWRRAASDKEHGGGDEQAGGGEAYRQPLGRQDFHGPAGHGRA